MYFALKIRFVRRNGYNKYRHALMIVLPSITSHDMTGPDMTVLIIVVFIQVF